jgi:ribosomal-protein-alanine N-acetyltransferase
MAAAGVEVLGVPAVAIRAMRETDLADVVRIECSSYEFPWTDGIFRDCLRVSYCCRVVELGAQLIGHGVMSLGAAEAHLLNLCIAAQYRCRGIGRLLLRDLLRAAAAGGAAEAFLEARPSNLAAIRLYQSLGFSRIGLRHGYYQATGGREDAIVLKRSLD